MDTCYKSLPFVIKRADRFFLRLKGLMFRKRNLDGEGLWITPCNSIHMCFMNFAIDAVFLSRDGEIVKIVEQLEPWRFVSPVRGAHSVVELPMGTARKYDLQCGNYLQL